jgi:hypothetical protein
MNTLNNSDLIILIILLFWTLIWKSYALWLAAKAGKKRWFIFLMLPINTLSIIDIIYIFYIAKKTPQDIIKTLKTKI